jgi:hypothetical protein
MSIGTAFCMFCLEKSPAFFHFVNQKLDVNSKNIIKDSIINMRSGAGR